MKVSTSGKMVSFGDAIKVDDDGKEKTDYVHNEKHL